MIKKLVLLVILIGCWSLALADTKTLTISDLLIQSGTEEQLETRPLSIKVGLKMALEKAQNPDEKTKLAFKRVENAVDKAFNKKKVMRFLLQRVKNAFSQKELKAMNKFIESPLGKRLTEMGIKMADEKEIQYVLRNSSTIMKEANKDPIRLKIIQSLIDTMGTIEQAVNDTLDLSLATAIALFNVTPERKMPPMEVLEKNIEQQRFIIRGKLTRLVLASSVYAYRSFSNEELTHILDDALREVYKQYAKDMSEIVAKTAKQSVAS